MAFLLLAFYNTLALALPLFRYRSSSTYYSNGDTVMSTNFWKFTKYVYYLSFSIWTFAFISQLLSLLEIRRDVNLLVWLYVIFYFSSFVNFIIAIFYFIAYEKAYSSE